MIPWSRKSAGVSPAQYAYRHARAWRRRFVLLLDDGRGGRHGGARRCWPLAETVSVAGGPRARRQHRHRAAAGGLRHRDLLRHADRASRRKAGGGHQRFNDARAGARGCSACSTSRQGLHAGVVCLPPPLNRHARRVGVEARVAGNRRARSGASGRFIRWPKPASHHVSVIRAADGSKQTAHGGRGC